MVDIAPAQHVAYVLKRAGGIESLASQCSVAIHGGMDERTLGLFSGRDREEKEPLSDNRQIAHMPLPGEVLSTTGILDNRSVVALLSAA